MPLFSGNKYETNVTKVVRGVKFPFPSVHLDTNIISKQGPDWYSVIYYAMTQLSIKEGMKIFITRGVDSFSKEINRCTSATYLKILTHTHSLSKIAMRF